MLRESVVHCCCFNLLPSKNNTVEFYNTPSDTCLGSNIYKLQGLTFEVPHNSTLHYPSRSFLLVPSVPCFIPNFPCYRHFASPSYSSSHVLVQSVTSLFYLPIHKTHIIYTPLAFLWVIKVDTISARRSLYL